MPNDPFRPPDADSRALAARLIREADHAALAVTRAETGTPSVSRIALCTGPEAGLLSLVSDLAPHTAALRAHPRAALLVGEAGRGDPLAHPRLTLHVVAAFVPRDGAEHRTLRAQLLDRLPKTKLYIDFADFHIVTFTPEGGLLNGGFGRATRLDPCDLP
ncbi:hypothetical protein SAMN04490244_102249 [Tranquillimonas rosea]|uniref:Uncharacterized protein n=1 Tax=Tranquillimonas rosea TaxID=641238 RepID=A0A1H9RF40_9RHOB|nr:pyridoxamine 5'-phosphate oxidase family protein [Tranquillimonas rosea]SER71338.1 hypothetical protein SAMN04490244_102249 [Tranquillimonas rosea]